MLTSASYAKDAFEFFAMVQSYTIILNNVPLHDDIWLTDLRGLSTDKICRADVLHGEKSYVFVKGITTSTGETITMRNNVTLYGSLPSTTAINTGVEETTDKNGNKYYDNEKIEEYKESHYEILKRKGKIN